MSDFNVDTLENCLILLDSSKPFLKKVQINENDCPEPFTRSGNIANGEYY